MKKHTSHSIYTAFFDSQIKGGNALKKTGTLYAQRVEGCKAEAEREEKASHTPPTAFVCPTKPTKLMVTRTQNLGYHGRKLF